MKVYISLPIIGRDIEEVEANCIYAKGVIQKFGHEAVSPFDVLPNPEATYAEHLGNRITALLECEAVLFLDGWRDSNSCRLEQYAAALYVKDTFYSFIELKNAATQPTVC